jgi:ribosomal-protein-alanine N-acetyltransferase
VKLLPLDDGSTDLVAAWLADGANHQWLDFGGGLQVLTSAHLKIMRRRELHLLMTFTPDSEDLPIGVVALSNIAPRFGTATLWYVLGDKRFSGHGYTTRAVSGLLGHAFHVLKLRAVNAWAADSNTPSIRILTRNRFRLAGRQRECHVIEGRVVDRLLFDLLASEYWPL